MSSTQPGSMEMYIRYYSSIFGRYSKSNASDILLEFEIRGDEFRQGLRNESAALMTSDHLSKHNE